MSYSIIVYDDTGAVYLACQSPECHWETEVCGWDLESINDKASEHEADKHDATVQP